MSARVGCSPRQCSNSGSIPKRETTVSTVACWLLLILPAGELHSHVQLLDWTHLGSFRHDDPAAFFPSLG
jgi:hypothetical protein